MAIRENLIQARSLYVGVSPNVAPASSNLGVDGSIGIGTPTPISALSIYRGAGSNAYIEVSGGGSSLGSTSVVYGQDSDRWAYVWNRANQPVAFGTNNSLKMTLTAAGELALGTSTPLLSNSPSRGNITINGSTQSILTLGVGGIWKAYLYTDGNTTDLSSADYLVFGTAGGYERMRIAASGNVGIGTTNPQTKLEVTANTPSAQTTIKITNTSDSIYSNSGLQLFSHDGSSVSAGTYLLSTSNNFTYGTMSPNQTNLYGVRGGGIRIVTGVAPIIFGNGANDLDFAIERMRIANNGNVGIGTTNPGAKLDITSTSGDQLRISYNSTYYWEIGRESADGRLSFTDSQNGEKLTILPTGNVGIGTTAPTSKLHITDYTPILRMDSQKAIEATYDGEPLVSLNFYKHYSLAQGASIRMQQDGGIYSYPQAALAFYTNDGSIDWATPIERMRIKANGQSVLTADAGNEQFVIRRLSNNNSQLIIGYHSSGYARIQAVEQNIGYTPLVLNQDGGNVGIGTSSPGYKLDVNGAGRFIFRNNSNEITDLLLSTESANSKSKLSFLWYGNETAAVKFLRGGNSTGSSMEFWTQQEFGSTTQRMTITSSGNVGIGTTAPSQILDVVGGNIRTTKSFISQGGNDPWTGAAIFMDWQSTFGRLGAYNYASGSWMPISINDNSIYITGSNGNVGVGTTSPGYKLHVAGTGYYSGQLTVDGFNNNSGISFREGFDPSNVGIRAKAIGTGNRDGLEVLGYNGIDFTVNNGANVAMRILGTAAGSGLGNVGIGTTNPQSKLQIGDSYNSTSGTVKLITLNTGGYYSTTPSNQYNVMGFTGTVIDASDIYSQTSGEVAKNFYIGIVSDAAYFNNNRFSIVQGGVERLTVQGYANSGNVGIGTTSPTSKLSITDGATMYANQTGALIDVKVNASNGNDTTSRSGIRLGNNSNAFSIFYGGTTDRLRFVDGGNIEVLTLVNGGNVGIGTTAPAARLEVYGSGFTSSSVNFLARNGVGTKIITSYDDGFIQLNNLGNSNQAIYVNSSNANRHYALDSHVFSVVDNNYSMTEFVAIKGNADIPAMGVGTVNPHRSAILDLTSRNKGFLPPRMTNTEMNAIATPAAGLVVYDNTNNKLCVYNGSSWVPLH